MTSSLAMPAPGSIVGIGDPDAPGARAWRTRVEWCDGPRLGLVAPLRPAGGPWDLPIGSSLEVVWPSELGLMLASVRLKAIEHDVVDLWVLDVARVERCQRREAYRLSVSLPTELSWSDGTLAGTVLDLSERGVRCRVPARGAPENGSNVDLRIALAIGPPLALAGEVVRIEPVHRTLAERTAVPPAPPSVDLGIRFVDIDAGFTEALRRFVFEEQLRRRAGS